MTDTTGLGLKILFSFPLNGWLTDFFYKIELAKKPGNDFILREVEVKDVWTVIFEKTVMASETGLRQSETVDIMLVILIPSNIKNIIPFFALHLMQLLFDLNLIPNISE